jgi:hypothetical protein
MSQILGTNPIRPPAWLAIGSKKAGEASGNEESGSGPSLEFRCCLSAET